MTDSKPISKKQVRTHVITGFLGTGKTTLILHLLKHKPTNEKWAVLVNEFGEIGVDGAILQTQMDEGSGVAIREVPGGCLCCTAGLPFQIGMNWLIAREKPDVLLIEPTGLGHPAELLDNLRADGYLNVLALGATVTLVDPRHLSQPRYRQHEIYSDQLAVADVLVANKSDMASNADWAEFDLLVQELNVQRQKADKGTLVEARVSQGQLNIDVLDVMLHGNDEETSQIQNKSSVAAKGLPLVLDLSSPKDRSNDQDYLRIENLSDGILSIGWLVRPDWVFSLTALRTWLSGLEVERAKAVMNTDAGRRIFNLREGALTEMEAGGQSPEDSRLELILVLENYSSDVSGEDTNCGLTAGWQSALLKQPS